MRILLADGIGTVRESSGVLDPTARLLAAETGARVERIAWPAAMAGIGGDSTWAAGAARGVADLQHRAARDTDDLVLLAYSGGNRVVHQALTARPDLHRRIRAVGLVSDPYRPRDRWQLGLPDPGGWGLCGERPGPLPGRTVWSAVEGDVITAAAPDALLRTVADLSAHVPGGLRRDLHDVLLSGRFQLSWQIDRARDDPARWSTDLWRRARAAAVDVRRYFGGWHTTHYTRPHDGGPSLAERLADELLGVVAGRVTDAAQRPSGTHPVEAIAASTSSANRGDATTTSGR